MLKYYNGNQKNFIKTLLILSNRKLKQFSKSNTVKKIIANVRNEGDKAILKYEKKFSKIKLNVRNIKFTKKINIISKKIDKKLKDLLTLLIIELKNFTQNKN